MQPSSLILIFTSMLSWAAAAPEFRQQKRDDGSTSLGRLVAYGIETPGPQQVFFRDSAAFIGNASGDAAYTAFFMDKEKHLLASAEAMDSFSYLAINTTTGARGAAILTSDTTLSTSGFFRYGNSIAWLTSAGILQDYWYAEGTDIEGVWALKWAGGGLTEGAFGGKFPIVLKTDL